MRMEGTYPVAYRGKKVGSVSLRRCGLYYELFCCCQLAGDEMLQLMMTGPGQAADLGLLIPCSDRLELRKRISAKRLGEGSPTFCLRYRQEMDGSYYPVDPDQPFLFLHRLEDCIFEVRDGQTGILFHNENNGEKVKNNT
jgi:hypothetical protein